MISGVLFVRANVTVPLQVLRIVKKPDIPSTDVTLAIVQNQDYLYLQRASRDAGRHALWQGARYE